MFKERSHKKELLDADVIPDADLYQNLRELNTINTLLGGYNITFNALKKVLMKDKEYVFVDIGCGGGDTVKHIYKWNKMHSHQLKLYGIDLKETCVNYAHTNDPNNDIQFICDDYRNVYTHLPKIDILHACLFCHHLSDAQIIELIQFAHQNNSTLIINDLERNSMAYYAIKLLTSIFSKSYLVKNDAPLSVLRGFKKKEWIRLIEQSGVTNYSVKYKWAFRHEVIIYAKGGN